MGRHLRDVAKVVALVGDVQPRVGRTVVGLDRLGLHLAEEVRGPRQGPTPRELRCGAALFLGLELAEHPSGRVVVEGAGHLVREIDTDRRDLLPANVAESVEVGDLRG
jgi:hypothetical protein